MRFGFDATTGFGIPQKSDSDLREREGNAVTGVWVGICVPQKKNKRENVFLWTKFGTEDEKKAFLMTQL